MPARRHRLSSILLVFVLAALTATGACGVTFAAAAKKPTGKSHGKHRPKPPPPPAVHFPSTLAGSPAVGITMPPVGLSLEYPVMAQAMGSGECPPPALTAELQRLGSPPLELAGQSQDMTAPSGAVPNPVGSWEA